MLSAHLTAEFGNHESADITTADVQLFLNERSQLSRKTLKLMLDFMGQMCKDAKMLQDYPIGIYRMALMMLTGMRRGEALGLQWNDISWEKGLIHVRQNVIFAGNQPHVGTPKTEKGTRQIPIVGCRASTWSQSE